jgi:hypothetical protein
MKYFRGRILRVVSLCVALNILTSIVAPTVTYALTAGPTSPEFSSFEPVATTDMVNVFTGDFTYNLPALDIPGPDGAGYSLSLAYHSGTSQEEEASWVGYGWTLNPGAINRNTRGFPDDYSQARVDQYNKTRPNWSAGSTTDIGLEFFSQDSKSTFGINASTSIRFNNYQGFQRSYGLGLEIMGMVSVGMNYSAEGITYSGHVNPAGILNRLKGGGKPEEKPENAPEEKTDKQKKIDKLAQQLGDECKKQVKEHVDGAIMSGLGSAYGLISFDQSSKPLSLSKYEGSSFNFSTSIQINAYLPIGIQVGVSGNFNMQANEPQSTKSAFGFMNNIAEAGENQMSDYYVEKGNAYGKRDLYLGVPFNNADNFTVTGEGLSGGFRYYPQKNGHFYADKVKSKTKLKQAGIEFMVGQNLGIGIDIGLGFQKLEMENWPSPGVTNNTGNYKYAAPAGAFRFNNDLGGEIEYSANNVATSAKVTKVGVLPGFVRASLEIHPDTMYTYLNGNTNNLPAGRSSFVDYHTYAQLNASPLTAFNKSANLSDMIYRSPTVREDLKTGIAEISVHNEDGNQFVYGLPTYSNNETSLQFDIKKSATSIYDNYIAYKDVAFNGDPYTPNLSKHEAVIGEVKRVPYANNYLLTQILTSDYVDVGIGGVSDDDFGGWTQFNYHKAYGGNEWYRFRTPYTGLLYQKNSISDTKDDLGSVMTGEKEVYYLKSIETKTHIAFFITNKTTESRFPYGYGVSYLRGSDESRLDGLGANKELDANGFEKASKSKGSAGQGDDELEYLEKIVLFSKARKDKPIKTTRFAYSYDLVQNLPNNANGNFPGSKSDENSGKLTLEKVWFEYEGIVNSKVSPYVFKYEYKDKDEITTQNENALLQKYPDFDTFLSTYTKESQNPDYNPHLLDPWGNIQNFGKEQQVRDRPWIYQGPDKVTTGAKKFDPAAWQLKQIKLPSGGEILVEYEQKDYRFVQDRAAMAMSSLVSVNDSYTDPSYVVNVKDLNITKPEERAALIEMIKSYYMDGGEKIYFKFLYALRGTVASLDFCKSDYIDGYAKVKFVEAVSPGSTTNLNIKITLEGKTVSGTSGQRYNSPRQGCYDFVSNQRVGKVDEVDNECVTSYEDQYDDDVRKIADGSGMSDIAIKLSLVPTLIAKLHADLYSTKYTIPDKDRVCMKINEELSYLKLPMVTAKKGGGVRVKRLYMLDHGLETGDASLYGSEYLYQDEDGNSSGVATNEPAAIRAENPLVTFLPKKNQSWFSKITTGEEKDQTEGPIGESLLPSASIGYSRIVVKNIHEGPTGTGFAVHEYYTAYKYPFDREYGDPKDIDTEIRGKGVTFTDLGDNTVRDRVKIPAGFFSYSVDKAWAAQGFRFVINNMHGQIKTMATYGGDYKDFGTDKVYLSSLQQYSYFEPGETLKVLKPDGTYTLETPGKEMDVAMEAKSLHDNTMDFSIEMDISITISVWPPVFFSLWPSFQLSDNRISTHCTSKVLRYPTIVKSVLNYKDGVYNYTENLAFNGANGKPIYTRTADGFDKVKIGNELHDGSIYTLTIPAWWKYASMGQKALNINNTNQLGVATGSIVSYSSGGNLINSDPKIKTWSANVSSSNNVLSAQVQTFSNSALNTSWFSAEVQANYPLPAGAKAKLDKIWRPYETFAYKADATSSNGNTNADPNKIYNGGFFKTFSMFDWTKGNNAQTDPNWLKLNQVTKYSPHGSALEEKNILGIYSSVKYDYSFGNSKNLLPVMMTSNGEYRSIAFESFETSGNSAFSHAGSKSIKYIGTSSMGLLSGLSVSNQLSTKGGIVKLWLKSDYASGPMQPDIIINSAKLKMDRVAKTGEWTLYSVNVDKSVFPAVNAAFTVAVAYAQRAGENVYIDDIRFQPIDAQSKCYVYDVTTFKLLTQFDDQHFGLFFQYNSEGKLVRKQIETEKGLKTIQETQYNTPKTLTIQ